LILGSSAEVPTREDERSHKGPDIKQEACPTGTHLDPHSWPLAGHGLEVGIRAKKKKKTKTKRFG
jgi:hypothetical protein